MALAYTQVLDSFNDANQDNYDTASVTLEPGRLYILSIASHRSTGNAEPSAVVHDLGVGNNTFALVSGAGTSALVTNWDPSSQKAIVQYYIEVGSTTNNAPINLDFGSNVSRAIWSLGYYTGFDSTTKFLQVRTGTSGTGTGTSSNVAAMLSLTTGSSVHCDTSTDDSANITPEAGFTEDSETQSTESQTLEVMHAIDGGDDTPTTTFATAAWAMIATEVKPEGVSLTYEQEGFQFYLDDAGESSSTTIGSQDENMTAPTGENRRLRTLINTSGDAPGMAYRLEYRRVGAGTWKIVGPPPTT